MAEKMSTFEAMVHTLDQLNEIRSQIAKEKDAEKKIALIVKRKKLEKRYAYMRNLSGSSGRAENTMRKECTK